jgi:hypothetical protein
MKGQAANYLQMEKSGRNQSPVVHSPKANRANGTKRNETSTAFEYSSRPTFDWMIATPVQEKCRKSFLLEL